MNRSYIPFNPGKVIKPIQASEDREKQAVEIVERIIPHGEVIRLINATRTQRDRVLLKTPIF